MDFKGAGYRVTSKAFLGDGHFEAAIPVVKGQLYRNKPFSAKSYHCVGEPSCNHNSYSYVTEKLHTTIKYKF